MHAAGRPIAILLAESIDNNESDNQHVEKSKSTSQYLHWGVLGIREKPADKVTTS
jgi:hypothetical protein